MQHRVPVIYPSNSGAAEVLKWGVQVPAQDINTMSSRILALLNDLDAWESTVLAEANEIDQYPGRRYEDRIIEAWQRAAPSAKT